MSIERLGLAIIALLATAAVSAADQCVKGRWELQNYQYLPDGSVTEGRALSDRYCLADDVIMDEFRSLDAGGEVNFRGVSFQVQEGQGVAIFWAMVGDPGYTSISGQYNGDGDLVTAGTGEDMLGTFDERFVMNFASDGLSYEMQMDRNYTRQDAWIAPFNRLVAKYTSDEVAGLPDKPVAWVADKMPKAQPGTQIVILDGWAVARLERRDDDVTVTFSSRYRDPDRWRTLEWSSATGNIAAK